EGIVAQELPGGSMVLLGPRLDNSGHGGRGGQAKLGTVVRRHFAEFGNRVKGGHDVRTAGTTTVIAFCPIEQIKIVAFAHAIKAHVGVAADRSRNLKIALPAGSAWSQGDERVHATAVSGELTKLLTGNNVTDLAVVRLHCYGGSFHRNLLRCTAHLEFEVDTRTIVYVEHDVLLLNHLKPRTLGAYRVTADVKVGNHELPVATACQAAHLASFNVGNRYS